MSAPISPAERLRRIEEAKKKRADSLARSKRARDAVSQQAMQGSRGAKAFVLQGILPRVIEGYGPLSFIKSGAPTPPSGGVPITSSQYTPDPRERQQPTVPPGTVNRDAGTIADEYNRAMGRR